MSDDRKTTSDNMQSMENTFINVVDQIQELLKRANLANDELRVGSAFWAGVLAAKDYGIGPSRVVQLFMAILQSAGAAVEIHTMELGPPSEAKN